MLLLLLIESRMPFCPDVIWNCRGSTDPLRDHLSQVCDQRGGRDASRCLPLFLRVHRLWAALATERGRLLRVLLIWNHQMPAMLAA